MCGFDVTFPLCALSLSSGNQSSSYYGGSRGSMGMNGGMSMGGGWGM